MIISSNIFRRHKINYNKLILTHLLLTFLYVTCLTFLDVIMSRFILTSFFRSSLYFQWHHLVLYFIQSYLFVDVILSPFILLISYFLVSSILFSFHPNFITTLGTLQAPQPWTTAFRGLSNILTHHLSIVIPSDFYTKSFDPKLNVPLALFRLYSTRTSLCRNQ